VQITEERKKRVIDLYFNQHKTYAEIAEIERMSPRDIHAIVKEEKARRQTHKAQQQEEISSKAYKLFSEGKRTVEVAIALSLREPEATKFFIEYWKLKRLHILNKIYKETNGKLAPFLKLYRLMKEKGMTVEQVVNAVEIAIHKLPYMESLYKQLKDEVDKLQNTIQGLLKNIDALKYKISILDKTAFACEQDCKRKEQQVQELTAQKDTLEKWIANISNNDDDLKQLVKEYVKSTLSENKQAISVAFTALIQTLKNDPAMVNLVYSISSTYDGEHHKDDNSNNVTKYLESNKDNLLDLTEKQYENLTEVLTNNAIDTAAAFNSASSLPQSSSTFPKISNQSDSYRIEEEEIYHNSEGDITD
jgi:hypothetical protein